MQEQSNSLSAEQLERLALLVEEMGEVSQVVGKIIRHGFESCHPNGGPTNREQLEKEIAHIAVAIRMLMNGRDLDEKRVVDHTIDKARSINPWLHHNYIASYFFDVTPYRVSEAGGK
jgi:hypothetical protein